MPSRRRSTRPSSTSKSTLIPQAEFTRRVRDTEGANIFMAHDPDAFKAQKHSPEFYE